MMVILLENLWTFRIISTILLWLAFTIFFFILHYLLIFYFPLSLHMVKMVNCHKKKKKWTINHDCKQIMDINYLNSNTFKIIWLKIMIHNVMFFLCSEIPHVNISEFICLHTHKIESENWQIFKQIWNEFEFEKKHVKSHIHERTRLL